MKTTLDLPDDLMREVKILAARESRKLKDTVADLLARGMRSAPPRHPAPPLARPVRLKRGGPLNIQAIESSIARGRD
jgi:hypothetical protein